MEYRRLGKTGMRVSEIALGSWITAGGEYDPSNTIRIHLKAFDLGINTFDTADVYNAGAAEEIVGKAVAQLKRSDVVIATKCRGRMRPGPNGEGLNKKHVIEACDASLQRLGTDYIDFYQYHWPDEATPIEESVLAIGQLLRQGKILYWGLSNFTTQQTADMIDTARRLGVEQPVSHQPKYNLFRRDIEETLMPLCAREGLGFVVYSPLEQGLLTGKYLGQRKPPADSRFGKNAKLAATHFAEYNQKALTALAKIAKKNKLTLTQLSLAWILRQPSVSCAIVGATTLEQIAANATAAGVKLDEKCLAEIEAVLQRRWARIKIGDFQKVLKDVKGA
ncbi:MAG: aldo/keto reductase [Planctomycetota bacterium]